MKKYFRLIFILFAYSCLLLKAQENISQNIRLKEPLPSKAYNYNATESVVFLPGFSFKATANNNLRAWINPLNLSPNPYPENVLGGSDNNIVGKIGDEFTVTPQGQAAYEIPITLPSGTGGITPQLSILYNSSSKNGLLGYGFDLSGLSMINRTPQNLHVDGKITAVDFSSNDRFMLDGNRLIRISPITQKTDIEYRTESNTFSKIIANGNESDPSTFTVYTKSGLTYTYGSNNMTLRLSTRSTSSSSLFWLLTKVIDTKGNYYTISYNKDDEGDHNEYWPNEIKYTGNTNTSLDPYCSIKFNYKAITPNDVYISGHAVRRSKLLTNIEIKHGTKKIKSYDFTYQTNLETYLLESVTEIASDGTKKNPTKFDWNANSTSIGLKKNGSNVSQTFFETASAYVSDFNGDGFSDFMTLRDVGQRNMIYRLFWGQKDGINHTSNQTDNNYFFNTQKNIEDLRIGDFNGDGIPDVVLKVVSGDYTSWDLYFGTKDKTFSFVKQITKYNHKGIWRASFGVGDFNGDGIDDFYIHTFKNKSSTSEMVFFKGDTVNPLSENQLIRNGLITWATEIQVVDINGDGFSDIVCDNYSYCSMLVNKGNFFSSTSDIPEYYFEKNDEVRQSVGSPDLSNHYFGDFNGDGKTDILYIDYSSLGSTQNPLWVVRFSTGKGYTKPQKVVGLDKFNQYISNTLIGDFNGDGIIDIYAISPRKEGQGSDPAKVYYNKGTGLDFQEYNGADGLGGNINNRYHLGDFNGDGIIDILEFNNKGNNAGYKIYTSDPKLTNNNLLSSITDGLGYKTEISYKPLTDKSVYSETSSKGYPLQTLTSSMYVVDKIFIPDGIGGKSQKQYSYKNAVIHKRGRGFLGFEYFIENDVVNNIVSTSQFEINSKEYVTALKSVEVRVGGKLLNKTTYTNRLRYYQDKVFTYDVIGTNQEQYEINTNKIYSSTQTRTVYDDNGNVTRSVQKYNEKDSVVNVNVYEDNLSKWYLGRLIESTVTKINPKGTVKRVSKFGYDPTSGLLNKEEVEPDNIQLGYTKTYTHDEYGNILSSTTTPKDPKFKARIKTSVYDPQGRFETESKNYLGHITRREINYDLGLVKNETDPNDLKTEYLYDSFGQPEYTKTALGNTHSMALWAKGHPYAPTNALYFTYSEVSGMPPAIEFFDCLGRSIRQVAYGVDYSKIIYTDVVYNSKGQVEKTSEPYFAGSSPLWNTVEYDAIGRVKKQTYPDNTFHTYEYDGLKTTTTSPLGIKNIKIVDEQGRLTKSIDNNDEKVEYAYDGAGNCETVVGPRTKIEAKFDIIGNRIKLIDPDLGTIESKYNAFGELVWQKTGEAIVKTIEYDDGGRVLKSVENEGETNYLYDTLKKGFVTSISSPNYYQAYKYDVYGRITDITETIDKKSYTTQTTYDKYNRVKEVVYPSKFAVKHEYMETGYLRTVRNSNSGQAYWTANTMDARGQLETFTLGNGLKTTKTYNPAKGYVETIKTPGIQDWKYEFDADGNLTMRKDNSRNLTESFKYDNMNRLSDTYHNNVLKESVKYDIAGNITSKTGVGTKFEYFDKTNRLKSVSGGSYTPPDWDIEYTSFNKISKVTQSNNCSLVLMYGADKQRKKAIQTKEGKTDTRYYVGALYEENELSTGEVKKIHHIFANGGAIAIFEQSTLKGESILYLHKDHLGSIQAYSDKDGKLVQELSYDAWGRRRSANEWRYYLNISDAKALYERGFTGHEHLDMFDMINMNGRMYDPMLGRFLSPDPYIQAPDFTQSLNRYIYCVNNPLSLIDPSGYGWFSDNWKSLTAAVVGITVAAVVPGGQTLGAVILKGAIGGAASGLAGALLNGANIGQMSKSTIVGGFWGGASAGAAYGVGSWATGAKNELLRKLIGHSMSQGYITALQGGNFKHGFISGLVSAGGGYGMSKYGGNMTVFAKVSANAIIGGTASELGGGKFANGAITAAYVMLFNELAHDEQKDNNSRIIEEIGELLKGYIEIAGSADAIGLSFSGGVGMGATVEADLVTVVYFLTGEDENKVVLYGSGSVGTILGCSLSGSVNFVLFYYQGDVNNFNRNSIAGHSNDVSVSVSSNSYTRSVGDLDKYNGRVVSHSIGVSKGFGTDFSLSFKRQNTKIFRPFRNEQK